MRLTLHAVPELAHRKAWYAHPPLVSNGHVHTILAAKLRTTRAVIASGRRLRGKATEATLDHELGWRVVCRSEARRLDRLPVAQGWVGLRVRVRARVRLRARVRARVTASSSATYALMYARDEALLSSNS